MCLVLVLAVGQRTLCPPPNWALKGGASALGNGSRKCVMEKSIRASEYVENDVNITERFKAEISYNFLMRLMTT